MDMYEFMFITSEDAPTQRICNLVGTKRCYGIVIYNAKSRVIYRKYKDVPAWYGHRNLSLTYVYMNGKLRCIELKKLGRIMGYGPNT